MSFKTWSQAQGRAGQGKPGAKGKAVPADVQPEAKAEITPDQPAQLPAARKP